MNILSKWCASGYTPEPPIIAWCPLVNLSHNMSQSLGLSSRNSWLESLKTKTIHDYFGVFPDWFEYTLHVNLNIPRPSLTSKNEGHLKAQTSGVSSLLFCIVLWGVRSPLGFLNESYSIYFGWLNHHFGWSRHEFPDFSANQQGCWSGGGQGQNKVTWLRFLDFCRGLIYTTFKKWIEQRWKSELAMPFWTIFSGGLLIYIYIYTEVHCLKGDTFYEVATAAWHWSSLWGGYMCSWLGIVYAWLPSVTAAGWDSPSPLDHRKLGA